MIRPAPLLAFVLLASTAGPALADDRCPSPVTVQRAHSDESAALRLVDCEGNPNLESLDELSMLARPTGTPRPSPEALAVFQAHAPEARRERFVSPGIRRLDDGLLVRLQTLAEAFDGKPLSIVSGYRPRARRGSRHRHGRALDVAVEGVARREVALFARSLPNTGVGYYPNSSFTHIDVREESYHWVDLSGPGERPRYVAWAEAFGDEAPPEGEPSGAPCVDDEPDARPIVASAEAGVPGQPAREDGPDGPPEPANEGVAAASAGPGASVVHAERDDAGRPVDLATTSAEARDAIRAHREARPFEALSRARDEDVDWSLPWW